MSWWFTDAEAQELKPREGEVRAVWIHTYAPFDWDGEMKKLADAGFNCVFFRAARGANTVYPSQHLPRDEWAEPLNSDELEKAVIAAHRNGLELHAWMVCFHVGGAAKQKGEANKLYEQMAKDDRLVRDLEGKQAPFLNPADPRNQELELNIAREIVEKYDVDGIHLDYIRYPEEPHYDFDYGGVSRREFEKKIGHAVEHWPQDVYSGALKWDYENWERENINQLVRNVYTQTKKLKPGVLVSAAVWRAHRYNRATIKQDWVYWANNGWLDFAVPMNYTTDDTQFRDDVRSQVADSAGRVLLVAGIGNYKHETPDATLRQIQIARDEGADGYSLFDYRPEKYEALLAALKQGTQSRNTYLPFRAPRLRLWYSHVGGSRASPQPLIPDRPLDVSGQIYGPDWTHDRNIFGELTVETPAEVMITKLAHIDTSKDWALANPPNLHWSFKIPQGRFRIMFRGYRLVADKQIPFVRRGLILGLPAGQIVALRYKQPPKFTKDKTAVAIYEGGMAASGVLKALQGEPNLSVASIARLQIKFWRGAKVLVLPQLRDVAELSPDVVKSLRDWVAAGGVLLLTHDAVGFRWHLRVFPEIGQGVALSKNQDVEIVPNDFGIAPGVWRHEYSDHVVLSSGKDGIVLAHEVGDATKPVLIGGKFGKGKVFLYGGLLGYAPDGVLDGGERRLLMEIAK